jgi:hypothetical protein
MDDVHCSDIAAPDLPPPTRDILMLAPVCAPLDICFGMLLFRL